MLQGIEHKYTRKETTRFSNGKARSLTISMRSPDARSTLGRQLKWLLVSELDDLSLYLSLEDNTHINMRICCKTLWQTLVDRLGQWTELTHTATCKRAYSTGTRRLKMTFGEGRTHWSIATCSSSWDTSEYTIISQAKHTHSKRVWKLLLWTTKGTFAHSGFRWYGNHPDRAFIVSSGYATELTMDLPLFWGLNSLQKEPSLDPLDKYVF